ncbi:hypothetical protein CS542_02345 [Pedobacter sp. IW39]|nr:hypothetical protein CS542_02345 [Pedobacter sp. IW39]
MKDAPIVLLDEATASLDPENELHIQAIQELVKNKTVIVVAHKRLLLKIQIRYWCLKMVGQRRGYTQTIGI